MGLDAFQLNPIATRDDHWTPSRECSRRASRIPMIGFLWGILVFIVRAIDFALDIAVSVSRMRRFARWVTGSDAIVEVPPDPKVLPPAAQRALAEAEQRRLFSSFASGK
jgi:hypothetical protein